jgi:hypothetical protein
VKRLPAKARVEESAGVRRWALVIFLICAFWLTAMVVTSMLGYEHKTPTRIQNWQPDRSGK